MHLSTSYMMSRLPNDPELRFRARLLLATLLALDVLVIGISLYFTFIVEFQMDLATRRWALNLINCSGAMLALLTALLWLGHFLLASYGTVAVATLAIGVTLYLTGGVPASPALPMLLELPVIVFCLLGLRWGLGFAVAVPLLALLQWLLTAHGLIALPTLQSQKNPVLDRVLTTMVSYATVIMVILVYERLNSRLRQERDQERQRLAHLATHDELTGVGNRRYFRTRLEESCARSLRSGRPIAVLIVDLDGFKNINDALGHAAGDAILAEIAGRLRQQVRREDLVSRLGGDEFALIVDPLNSQQELDQLCRRLQDSITQPLPYEGHVIQVGASIGAAVYPSQAADIESLLQQADASMYASKRNKAADDC